jgi:hypothetical protein
LLTQREELELSPATIVRASSDIPIKSQFPVGRTEIVENVTPPSLLRIGFVDRPTNTVSPSDEHATLHGVSVTETDAHVAPVSEDR